MIDSITNVSNSLLTDFYQITMAYGFWKSGRESRESVFHLFFRRAPFNGNYCIACGLENVISYIDTLRFKADDLEYLATIQGNDGKQMFEKEFLSYLAKLKFSCNIDAVPEGTIIFPLEPLIRIQGPIVQCQLLESPLLNLMNFPTLIATKAARICRAAHGDPVLEFGLRRAQGVDGAMTASRSAYIGGCNATSNVLAGKRFGIPVKGTIAHSWVMAFDDETDAFRTYAEAMPNNCVLLVDTYSTLEGVRKAIEVGKELEGKGYKLGGIRLDSGDLAYLSTRAREMMDAEGFSHVKIVASNDLDETIIQSLKLQQARIDIWGVGTKLVTGFDQPALDGVYKLSAVRTPGKVWEYKIKISEQTIKVTTPGIHQVRRFYREDLYVGDVIYDVKTDMSNGCVIIDPFDITRQKEIGSDVSFKDLLVPIYREGKQVYQLPGIEAIKQKVQLEIKSFHPTVMRLINPHTYPVGNEKSLNDLRTSLTLQARLKRQVKKQEPK
jgi:nicotinate phosphoribosyltransferase